MKVRLKRFDPTAIKPHRIILVVGKRGTGKSVLQRDLMYHMRDSIDFGLAMTPTEETADMFREHMPDDWIYHGFSVAKLDTMLGLQRELIKHRKSRRLMLILDDCMYDKRILKGIGIRDLFMNGRHLNICMCNAMQYVMDMGPDLRTQVDYIFALRENIISNKQKLWKYFFGMFEKYEDFAKVMDKCTDGHSAIVMDNTTGSNNIEDCIYWYKAQHETLPEFRMGKDVYWTLADRCQRPSEEIEDEDRDALETKTTVSRRISLVQREDGEGHLLRDVSTNYA
jgi:hypothetical protein